MKKITVLFLAVSALTAGFVSSCKKGKDDPFLSLRSRKARVEGEWKLVSQTTNDKNSLNTMSSTVLKFDKDGTGENTSTFAGNTNINKFNWSFASKSADYKNKERIVIIDPDGGYGEIFELQELSNEKMVWYYEYTNSSTVYKILETYEPK